MAGSFPDIAARTGAYRAIPDVAFNADPASGVAIYDSTPYNGIVGWTVIGGTSLSAPCWAGVVNCLISKRGHFASTADLQVFLYNTAGKTKYMNPFYCYRDIITGTAGPFSAGPGYDFVTGLGTPIVSNFIRLNKLLRKFNWLFKLLGKLFKRIWN